MGGSYSKTPSGDQRSVILLGETGAGKSAFGNFLLKRDCFKTGDKMISTTQSVEQQTTEYSEENINISLHVFDLPGLNDPRKVDTTHLNNAYSALKKCAKCMSTLFAIVIDISDTDELTNAVKEIQRFLDKVELPDFNLTDNALLVFSHADKLGATEGEANSCLYRTIESCPLLYKLWILVRFRHVLVDSPRYVSDGDYWREKMKQIIVFTRPKIRVLLLGPHQTAQTELLLQLRGKKGELGGVEELPKYDELDIEEVNLEAEGCSLTFERSFDFSSLDDLNEQEESKEKNNALNQINSLINSIAETHTFSIFCVVIKVGRLKSTFIRGIKMLAEALSEEKVDLFYNRCFFLFTHSNKENALDQCNQAFSNLEDLREIKASIDNRVAITNTHPDTPTEIVCELLKQVVSYSHAMKQKCYGKEFVSSILSSGFELPPDDKAKALNTTTSSLWPSKLTLGLLAVSAGGGVLAIAGAAVVILSAGTAAPIVAPAFAPVMLCAAPMAAAQIGTGSVAALGVGATVGSTLGAMGVGANTAVGSAVLYKLISQRKKKREGDKEYEYDFSTGSKDYVGE